MFSVKTKRERNKVNNKFDFAYTNKYNKMKKFEKM